MWQTCHKIQTHVGRGEAWTQLLQFSMPGREAGEQGDKENQVGCEIKTQRVNADGWGSKEQEKSSGLWACLEGKKYIFFLPCSLQDKLSAAQRKPSCWSAFKHTQINVLCVMWKGHRLVLDVRSLPPNKWTSPYTKNNIPAASNQ